MAGLFAKDFRLLGGEGVAVVKPRVARCNWQAEVEFAAEVRFSQELGRLRPGFSWAEVFCEPVFKGLDNPGLRRPRPAMIWIESAEPKDLGQGASLWGDGEYSLSVHECRFQEARFS